MNRSQLNYWLAHTALREIAGQPCSHDPDTCPHCTAQACLGLIHQPLDPPPAFLEGLEYAGERLCSATSAVFTRTRDTTPDRPFRLGILASSFDPWPHPGHLWAIQQALAANACHAILAALQEDPTVERPEKRKPALTVEERTEPLLACRYVHAVVTYRTEADLLEIMRDRQPAVRIIGEDHRHDRNTGDDLDPPIPVFWAKRKPEWSGTEFAKRIAASLR